MVNIFLEMEIRKRMGHCIIEVLKMFKGERGSLVKTRGGDKTMITNRVMKLVCLVGVAALAAGNGLAATFIGAVGATNEWETAGNWLPVAVPDRAYIEVYSFSGNPTARITTQSNTNLFFCTANGNGSYGSILQNGGTMVYEPTGTYSYCSIGQAGSGIYTINGGTLAVTLGKTLYAGYYSPGTGQGTLNINGGSVLIDGGKFIAGGETWGGTGYVYQAAGLFRGATNILANFASASYGYYSLTGGTSIWDFVQIGKAAAGRMEVANTGYLVVTNSLRVGAGNVGDLVVSNGNIYTVLGSVGSALVVGDSAGSTGTVTLVGGLLNADKGMQLGSSGGGYGRVVVKGGESRSLNGSLWMNGPSELLISNGVYNTSAIKFNNTTYTGSVYLSGGTLAVGWQGILTNVISAKNNFVFDGGTFSNINTALIPMNLPSASVSSNGAVIDDGGYGISISSVLNDVAGQAGKLVKKGSNTLTLSGACTYSGSTTVSNGTLKVAAGCAITNSSLITLASSTTTADVRAVTFNLVNGLGGNGTVAGQVIAQAGSGLYPGGANAVGTLTLTNAASSTLTLTNNGTLYIDVTTNTSDRLVVKGGLDLGPNAALTISSLPKLNSTEPYPIITYTGTMTGHFSQTNGLTTGWHVVEDPANSRVVIYGRAPGFVLTIQ